MHPGVFLTNLLRLLPIGSRILLLTGLNTLAVVALAVLIWDGATGVATQWQEVRGIRDLDRLLVAVDSDTGRLQSLIHRYFSRPTEDVMEEIVRRRDGLFDRLARPHLTATAVAPDVARLTAAIQAFSAGFDTLKGVNDRIRQLYEAEFLRAAAEMGGVYPIVDNSSRHESSLLWPALSKSRESFSALLVAANAFYLSRTADALAEARSHLSTIIETIPVMIDLADQDLQRSALKVLADRSTILRSSLDRLGESFAVQAQLLASEIDGNQAAMAGTIDRLLAQVQAEEMAAQTRFDATLKDTGVKVVAIGLTFLTICIVVGWLIGHGIRRPLHDLMAVMGAIAGGDYQRPIAGLESRDEIGAMARSLAVFKDNALARQRAEADLRAAKERAETALTELRETQRSLVQAEKLASLGGLVAGIAHEINTPIGITLTAASHLADEMAQVQQAYATKALKRSDLEAFLAMGQEVAQRIQSNCYRAAELIQSFKQVAVDQTSGERRRFNLAQYIHEVLVSLLPKLKRTPHTVSIDCPADIVIDGTPGVFAQIITNFVMNSLHHAYEPEQAGTIRIAVTTPTPHEIELVYSDDGKGIAPENLDRVFDPFFTTNRQNGGTGLGLNIVHNIVHQRLRGRITVDSTIGQGTRFTIRFPGTA